MSNLLKAEFYKLFHSWYFWGIWLFNLLLSSVLLLDSVGETSNLFFASIYNMPILYFLTIIFSALFVGNDFGRRTLQSYINAGHRRGKILFAKLVVHQIACMVILSFPLLLHSIIGTFVTKGALASIPYKFPLKMTIRHMNRLRPVKCLIAFIKRMKREAQPQQD